MHIHVVRAGDNFYKLSQIYQVPIEELIAINQLPDPNKLLVGQALLIPMEGSYHWLEEGETLLDVSEKYNLPLADLMRINQIRDPNQVSVGTRLYIPQPTRPTIDVGAYLDPLITGSNSVPIVNDVGQHLTYLNIFTYAANRDGTLTPVDDAAIIQAAYSQRVAPLMVLSNFENGTFSTELATDILNSAAVQNLIIDNALTVLNQKDYFGLDIDFEYLGRENREKFNAFMRKLHERVKPQGFLLSAALAPKLSDEQTGLLYEGHDYRFHGQNNDIIFLMTYEWGWSGGPPMAVSPIDKVRQVVEYAITEIPREKIMMGIPYYGYDWTLPFVEGGEWAESLSPQEAIERANKYNAVIQFDETAQTPFFYYLDEAGRQHVVWFEDARSIQVKLDLVRELGLRGFYYWVLRGEFPQNWVLVEDNFEVRKEI